MQRILTLALVALLALPALIQAQEDESAPRRRAGSIVHKRGELTISYYTMGNPNNSAHDLSLAASRIFGRSFRVEDGESVGGQVSNIFAMGGAVAVFDTPDQVKRVMAELPKMETAFTPQVSSRSIHNFTMKIFKLEFISANDAMLALQPFRRKIPAADGSKETVMNITVMSERNVVIVRDTEFVMDQITKVIAGVDIEVDVQPQPPITFSCYILAASAEKTNDALPRELAENLPKLVPFYNFRVLGTGMLRASSSSRHVELNMGLADSYKCNLEMGSIRYDARSKTVHIGTCSFELSEPPSQDRPGGGRFTLSTSTDIVADQYTVIAALGDTPYFLVLKARAD